MMDGVVIVDKEKGWTSHDVCAFIRSRFRIRKVGHAGTLDPMATGVLIVLVGRATKLSQSLSSCNKEYLGTMQLGLKTDSHDSSGQVLATASYDGVTPEKLEAVLGEFRGEIDQMPPMISALKHNGVRLYKLARQGKEVVRQKRKITVFRFDLLDVKLPEITFSAHVSKGTYLRTLVHDVGERLGCFAALTALRRTRCGEFSLSDALTISALKQMKAEELGRCVRMASAAYALT